MRHTITAQFNSGRHHYTLSFVAALAATMLWQRGYLWPLDGLPFAAGVKGQDIGQMVWNLWHTAEALAHGRNPYFAPEIFAPAGAPLAQHTLAAGFAPVTLLVKLLSGNAPLYPLYAYHIVVGLCFTLLLFFSYRLLRDLNASRTASALAAWGYAFSDFYSWHTIHLNHLAGWLIPLIAWGLVRCWQRPTRWRALWPAITAGLAIYFTEFAAYIWLSAALCALGLAVRKTTRAALREKLRELGTVNCAAAVLLAVALAAPFVGQILGLRLLKPQPVEATFFSSNLAALVVPFSEQSPVYAPLFSKLSDTITAGYGEPGAFLGFPVILLTVVGLVAAARRQHDEFTRQLRGLVAVLAIFWLVLSLGPRLQIFGTDTGLPLPYAIFGRLPPFDLSRTPVRLIALAAFFLMILAALGADVLLNVVRERFSPRAANAFSGLLALWLLAESFVPAPPAQKFTPPDLSAMNAGPVLNLPLYRTDGYATLLQTQHHQPLATGYLARNTETTWAHYVALANLLQRGGADFCAGVQAFGYKNVIIAPETTYVDDAGNFAALDLPACGIKVVDLRRNPEIDHRPAAFPPLRAGERVNLGAENAAPFLWYGWSEAETDFRWTKGTQAALVFAWNEAATPAPVSRITLNAGTFLTSQTLTKQRVTPILNDVVLPTLEIKTDATQVYEINLPLNTLRRENILRFALPDAAAPAALGLGADERLLGLRVEWFEISAKP